MEESHFSWFHHVPVLSGLEPHIAGAIVVSLILAVFAVCARIALARQPSYLVAPDRLSFLNFADILSEAVGRPIKYDPSTPRQFARHLCDAFGEEMSAEERAATEPFIEAFYTFNNTTPLSPFKVDMGPVLERIPIQMETMRDWARRQEWRITNKPRPPAG